MPPMNCHSARGIFAPNVELFTASMTGSRTEKLLEVLAEEITLARSKNQELAHAQTAGPEAGDFCQIRTKFTEEYIVLPQTVSADCRMTNLISSRL